MNKFTKTVLIAGGVCLGAGLIIVGIATGLARKNGESAADTYEKISVSVTEDFENIHIEEVSHDVKIVISDTDAITVEYWDNSQITHTCKVENDTLHVSYKNSQHWYDFIQVGFTDSGTDEDHSTVIYLPEGEYGNFRVDGVSADINVPEGYTFGDITFNTVSGDISCLSESTGDLEVNTTSGCLQEIYVNGISGKINTVSGDVNISDSTLSGSLVIDTVSGNIKFTNVTTAATSINTTSGDIVMNGYSSGNTSIDTTSGDIEASVVGTYNIDFDSVSGDSQISCNNMTDGSRFTVNTVSGDLTVREA